MLAYCKTDYLMSAEAVPVGTEVYNELEDAWYTAEEGRDIKLIGTVGEEWMIKREQLPQKYTYADGYEIDPYDLPEGEFDIAAIPGAEIVWAEQVYDQQEVQTSWGEVLTTNRPGIDHGDGDYIVYADNGGEPNYDDAWVVNGAVFDTTYVEA